MKEINQKKIEQNLILLKFLKPDVLAFTGAIFVAYQLKIIGLTLGQVMLVQSVGALTIFICEVPSGVISDLISRKLTFIFAEIFYTGSVIIFAFAQSFTHVIMMEILFGIAYATLSGTDSALLYDTLKGLNRENEFAKYQGQYISFFLFSIAIANIASGFVGEIDLRIPILACIPIPILQLLLSLFLKEPSKQQTSEEINSFKHTFNAMRWLVKYRMVFYFMLLSIFVALGRKIVLHTFNPFMELIEMPIKYWGILLAGFNLTAALASKYTHLIHKTWGTHKTVFIIVSFQISIFILMAKIHFLFAFIWPMVHFVIWPVATVVINTEINDRVGTDMRATVLSLSSFFAQSTQVVLLPVFGYFADLYTLEDMYLLLAGICFIYGFFIFFKIKFKNDNESNHKISVEI
jgi:MFS family permease